MYCIHIYIYTITTNCIYIHTTTYIYNMYIYIYTIYIYNIYIQYIYIYNNNNIYIYMYIYIRYATLTTLAVVWALWSFKIFFWSKLYWWALKERNSCCIQIIYIYNNLVITHRIKYEHQSCQGYKLKLETKFPCNSPWWNSANLCDINRSYVRGLWLVQLK